MRKRSEKMSNKQSPASSAQQLVQSMRGSDNVHVIPTKAAKIVKEMEKQIESLFAELIKSKSEVSKLSDLVEYQRDRIRALTSDDEEANSSKDKVKTPKESKNSDLAKPKKSKAKKSKKTKRVKKSP
jgi:hypothetical protein